LGMAARLGPNGDLRRTGPGFGARPRGCQSQGVATAPR
jgi:hypothetical protein